MDIDYKNQYFEYPALTTIQGLPSFDDLYKMEKEIFANAMSVQTTLGGGEYGHLGLVMQDTEYTNLPSATTYVRPENPGVLTIPTDATQHSTATQKSYHDLKLRMFWESQGVHRAIMQQIIKAIDTKYLTPLRNRKIGAITKPISEVIKYLKTTYGHVTIEQLRRKQESLEAIHWIPHNPSQYCLMK
jgi:hypothetical protein